MMRMATPNTTAGIFLPPTKTYYFSRSLTLAPISRYSPTQKSFLISGSFTPISTDGGDTTLPCKQKFKTYQIVT